MPTPPRGPLVFLDRDGVLNELVRDPRSDRWESPYAPGDVVVPTDAIEAVRLLRSVGATLVVVSNQPAAAKGTATLGDLRAVDGAVLAQFARADLTFDLVLYCHHHPAGVVPELSGPCDCRKPQPGLLLRAGEALSLGDLSGAWLIGDSDVDVQAGSAVGTRTILVDEPLSAHRRTGSAEPDYRVPSVLSAVQLVLDQMTGLPPGDT